MKIWGILLGLLLVCFSTDAKPLLPTLNIGYMGNLSGPNADTGRAALKALELVAQEYNSQGGISGRKIKIISYDSKGVPAHVLKVLPQLKKDKIIALTGIHSSNEGLLVSKFGEKNRLPIVVTTATHPDITKNKNYVIRLCFNNEFESTQLVRFAMGRMQAKNAVQVVDVGDSFSLSLGALFKKKFEVEGGAILQTHSIQSGERDFSGLLNELVNRKKKPDIIFSAAGPIESSYLLSLLASQKMDIPVLGNDGWQSAKLNYVLEQLSPTHGDIFFPVHWPKLNETKRAQNFVSSFKKQFGDTLTEANADAALTYDAGHFILKALKQAGSVEPIVLMRALRNQTLEGVTGSIKIVEGRDPVRPVSFLAIKGGRVTTGVAE